MRSPFASCAACSKRLTPHCPNSGCPWGVCPRCETVQNRFGRAVPTKQLRGATT